MTQNVLITGGNSGIGFEIAASLAERGRRVIIASRDAQKSAAAVARIKTRHPAADIEALALDLGSFSDIERFSAEVKQRMPVIDVLMLNAGLYTAQLQTLKNGYESMFGIMYLGHFRLAERLLESVTAAPQGRIIVTSSIAHWVGRIDTASSTDLSRNYLSILAYGQAKLADLLFARELARRVSSTAVTVNAFHPGGVATDLFREMPSPMQQLLNAIMLTPGQGADTPIWLATAPELSGVSGKYFVKRAVAGGSPASRDPDLAEKLWDWTEKALKDV